MMAIFHALEASKGKKNIEQNILTHQGAVNVLTIITHKEVGICVSLISMQSLCCLLHHYFAGRQSVIDKLHFMIHHCFVMKKGKTNNMYH